MNSSEAHYKTPCQEINTRNEIFLQRFGLCNFQKICFHRRMSAMLSSTAVRLAHWFVLGWGVIFFAGCSHPPQTTSKITPAEQLWFKVEYQDRTNDLRTAYRLSLAARNKLEFMSKTRPKELDYPICLAILNGRLFLMARSLGDTNAAEQFLLESGFYFNAERKEGFGSVTNYSAETIEYYIKVRDARVHPDQTNGIP